jgi:hypothetical protein
VPSVEQLNLGHLFTGLVVGGGVVAASGALAAFRAIAPALLAAAIVILSTPLVTSRPDGGLLAGAVVGGGVVAWSAHRVARRASPAIGLGLLVVALIGAWACVPDTEITLTTVGILLPATTVTAIGYVRFRKRGQSQTAATSDGPWWGASLLGVAVVWAVAASSVGRPVAAIGALGCLGLLVVVPVLTLAVPRVWAALAVDTPLTTLATVGVVQVASATICSRVAGLADTPTRAALVTALTLAASAGAMLLVTRQLSRNEPTPGP